MVDYFTMIICCISLVGMVCIVVDMVINKEKDIDYYDDRFDN
jgi:hypothetical protein